MQNDSVDRFLGCVLGLSLADAMGAPYEGGILERTAWRLLGKTRSGEMRWTDDTQMSIDLIESLIENNALDQDHLAARFARSYRWSRGYGPAAAKLLRRISRGANWRVANRSIYANGSFGNGAAMRAPIIGLAYANRPTELDHAAQRSAEITHAHPLAIEGAILIARATASATASRSPIQIFQDASGACSQDQFTSRLSTAAGWLESHEEIPVSKVTQLLGNGISAHESCVTALYLSLRFQNRPFLDLVRFITSGGGDADTIGAMAGAIWGAANGSMRLPAMQLAKLEQRRRLEDLARNLHKRFGTH